MHILQNNMDQKKANIIDRCSHTLGFTITFSYSKSINADIHDLLYAYQWQPTWGSWKFFSLAKYNLSNNIWSDVERFLRFMILSKITMNEYHNVDTQYYRDTYRARTSLSDLANQEALRQNGQRIPTWNSEKKFQCILRPLQSNCLNLICQCSPRMRLCPQLCGVAFPKFQG